jgi:cbb3-type cytochrome oxidase maturation protein
MSVILILILASLAVALAFLAGFIWAVKAGQFEDTCTPAMRILSEDDAAKQALEETGVFPGLGRPARASCRPDQQANGSPAPPLEERAGERRPNSDPAFRAGIPVSCPTNQPAVLPDGDDLLSLPLSCKGGEGNGTAAKEHRDPWKEQGARAQQARR